MAENIGYTPRHFLVDLFKKKEREVFDFDKLKKSNLIIDFSGVKSVGNNSYIQVEMKWIEPQEIFEGILYILYSFEKERNIEIISWFIEKTFDHPGTNMKTDIDGIWITHKSK